MKVEMMDRITKPLHVRRNRRLIVAMQLST